MTDRTYAMYNQSGYCASSAAAGTSARVAIVLDTAVFAVSIIIVRLFSLLVLKV